MAIPPKRPRNLDEAAGLVEPGAGGVLSESVISEQPLPSAPEVAFRMPRLGWDVKRISDTPSEPGFDDALALGLAPELENDLANGNPHYDPNGNPTQWGIDKTMHPSMNVGGLTRGEAIAFYLEHPMMWPYAKHVPANAPELRSVYFEGLINAGSNATKALQMAVGANADGAYGANTSKAVNVALATRGEEKVIREYFVMRKQRYDAIVRANPKKHGKNQRGWHNRVDDSADWYEYVVKARRAHI